MLNQYLIKCRTEKGLHYHQTYAFIQINIVLTEEDILHVCKKPVLLHIHMRFDNIDDEISKYFTFL